MHAWSKAQKAWYNKEYYRKNKERWLGENGYLSATKRWQLDAERRAGKLDDNDNRLANALERRHAARLSIVRAQELMRENNSLAKQYAKKADMYNRQGKRELSKEAAEQMKMYEDNASSYADQIKANMKREYFATGDAEMYRQIGNVKRGQGNRAPQAMVSNEDRKKNSKVKKAAKEFISNWNIGAKSIKDLIK